MDANNTPTESSEEKSLGNFNDIANQYEKFGCAPINIARCNWFVERINRSALIDLGFSGPKYTWKGPLLQGFNRIFERLDRALANDSWINAFPDCSVYVLPRVNFSDHNPLAVKIHREEEHFRLSKPFRYEAMWLEHEEYRKSTEEYWRKDTNHLEALAAMREHLVDWNKSVFGNVHMKKRNIVARLKGIKESKAYPYSRFLKYLETQLQKELDSILLEEEIDSFQKSRTKWITQGDRNTRYYHTKVSKQELIQF